MGLLNFFWPVRRSSAPTGAGRLGRVLHWAALLAALAWAAICVALGQGSSDYAFTAVVLAVVICIPLVLAGRGLRYVLAGE